MQILALVFCLLLFGPAAGGADPAPPVESSYARAIEKEEMKVRQREGPEGDNAGSGWGVSELLALAALVLAVGLMFGLARLARGGALLRTGTREMRLVDRLPLGRQAALLIVRVRGKDYWLSEKGDSVTLLAELPEAPPTREEPKKV